MENKYSAKGVAFGLLKCLGYLALLFAVQLLVVNFAAVVLTIKFPSIDEYQLTAMIDSLTNELNIFVGALTILLLAVLSMLRKDSLSKRASINKFPGKFTLNLAIMGVSASYAVTLVLGLLTMANLLPQSWVAIQNDAYSGILSSSPMLQFLSVGLMAPLVEEILFRGHILGALKKEMHPWIAILISAVFFGVSHGTPIGIIYATALGIVMGWLTIAFDSIVPSLLFHIAYNCTVAYSGGVSLGIAVISIPILIFEIMIIKNYFRGKKE